MKKVILLLAAFIVLVANAQERTITKQWLPKENTYYKYTGVAADVINGSTYDTISFIISLDKGSPISGVYTKTWFTLVGTADTTIACALYGKVFEDDTWTSIATGTFAGSADAGVALSSSISETFLFDTTKTNYGNKPTVIFDTTKFSTGNGLIANRNLYYATMDRVQPKNFYTATVSKSGSMPFYRYLKLQYIIAGNDITGTGSKIDKIEFKVPTY